MPPPRVLQRIFLALILLAATGWARPIPHTVGQGGLVDLRHGQLCIEMQGFGRIFDYSAATRFTLDGTPTTPEALAEYLSQGLPLSAVARIDRTSSQATSVDVSSGRKMKAVAVRIQPDSNLPLPAGSELKLSVSQAELKRLGLKKPWLSIPGLAHRAPLQQTAGNRAEAVFHLDLGLELRRLPIYLSEGEGEVYRGQHFGVSTRPPKLKDGGPRIVEKSLTRVPAWIDLEGPTDLLDHRATRLTVSGGAKIESILTRPNRIEFWLLLPTSGEFTVEAGIRDKLGRTSKASWTVTK